MRHPIIVSEMSTAEDFMGNNPHLPALFQAVQNLQEEPLLIRGRVYYVDPTSGLDTNNGFSPSTAFASLQKAYEACVSGRGDTIIVFSAGTTTAGTTSYLSHPLNWTKSGITVIGLASNCGRESRARISNVKRTTGVDVDTIAFPTTKTITDSNEGFLEAGFAVGDILRIAGTGSGTNDGTGHIITAVTAGTITCAASTFTVQTAEETGTCTITSYCASLLNISGSNNTFYNIHAFNGDTDALALGCLVLTGNRNAFIMCHFVGGSCTTQTANERSVELGAGAIANVFMGGTIGTDTINRGNNANCELYINGDVTTTARNKFISVEFLAWADGGTAHLAIKSAAATSMGRHMIFKDCDFVCYASNLGADQASVFGGTGFNTAKIFFAGTSGMFGYALWDAETENDCCFSSMPQGVAAGGKGIVAS